MLLLYFVLFYFSNLVNAFTAYNSLQIKNLKISKCDSKVYPVTVNNITVQLGSKPKLKVSGSMSSQVDLIGPIQASVYLKRVIWGIWIPVPCEDNVGSCTYKNLCDYGFSKNVSCPPEFIQNNVPCRCPISKGNYTIEPSISFGKSGSILSGTYKGIVTITQSGEFLSCYNIYFTLYDENEANSVILV